MSTPVAIPKIIWAHATVSSRKSPDEAMESAWMILQEKAKSVPPIRQHFSNRLRLISRNDVYNPNSGIYIVTLTAEITSN